MANQRLKGAADGYGDINDNENDYIDRDDQGNYKMNTKMMALTTKTKIPRTVIGWQMVLLGNSRLYTPNLRRTKLSKFGHVRVMDIIILNIIL